MLPFPPLLPLAVVELYLLHPLNELDEFALLARRLIEALDVEFAAELHEGEDPRHIKAVAEEEDTEDERMVVAEDGGKDEEVGDGEDDVQRIAHKERFDAGVVANALHDIARHLRVEVVQRQLHEFHQEVGYQRDVDARVDVEHNPTADETHGKLGGEESELGNEDERDETEVAVPDAHVNECLREEGEYHLQQAAQDHARDELHELSLEGKEIAGKEEQVALRRFLRFVVHRGKVRPGFKKKRRSHVAPVLARRNPALTELGFVVFGALRRRVGNVEGASAAALLPHLVEHHEMVLVPMEYARQLRLVGYLLHGGPDADGAHADALRRITDAEHRHPLPRNERAFAQRLQRVVPPVVFCHHAQARRTAVHRIKLGVVGKGGVEHRAEWNLLVILLRLYVQTVAQCKHKIVSQTVSCCFRPCVSFEQTLIIPYLVQKVKGLKSQDELVL